MVDDIGKNITVPFVNPKQVTVTGEILIRKIIMQHFITNRFYEHRALNVVFWWKLKYIWTPGAPFTNMV